MEQIILHEVGPRDGLQIEKTVVPTETKIRWIDRLAASGIDMIQVGSFVHKANVVRATDGLFLEAGRAVATAFPDIQLDEANVYALTMWLLKNPFNYDVLVAPNLYGDIISDLCAQMGGGLGFACSGNIGDTLAVFEPTHGSAPKYAGQHKVNPLATILAARMMLEWLGEAALAAALEGAVAAVIKEGRTRTYDMGGTHSTIDMARAVAAKL